MKGAVKKTMETFCQDLAKMLRTIRLNCGYTQQAVAKNLGMDRSTYSYYEIGKTLPDIIVLKKLAVIFDIPPALFFYPERFAQGQPQLGQRE